MSYSFCLQKRKQQRNTLDQGLLLLCRDTAWGSILLRCRFWFISFREDLKICISSRLPVDTFAGSSCTTFWVSKPELTHLHYFIVNGNILNLGKLCLGHYWELVALSSRTMRKYILITYELVNKFFIPGDSLFYVRLLSDMLTYINSEAMFFVFVVNLWELSILEGKPHSGNKLWNISFLPLCKST